MKKIRERLTEGLGDDDSAVVRRWLAGLSPEDRRGLAILWDRRGDRCSRAADVDEEGKIVWHSLPIVRGRFVRPGEVADDEEWRADHFEYLLDHPEIWVPDQPGGHRTFFIGCTAHDVAREVLATGRIPADFTCPLENGQCPLRGLLRLAPGQDFQLTGPPGRCITTYNVAFQPD